MFSYNVWQIEPHECGLIIDKLGNKNVNELGQSILTNFLLILFGKTLFKCEDFMCFVII